MQILDRTKASRIGKADFPRLEGRVKVRLHNPTTGKTEVIEGKNIVTNAIADIFASNYGGLMDYDSLMPLYSKMFGGCLCFANQLDDTSAIDYAIPSQDENEMVAHAGQTTYTDAADDLTRGNPNTSGLVLVNGAVTQEWEWASSQGNGTISSIALTHADTGNVGTGSQSNAFQSTRLVSDSNWKKYIQSPATKTTIVPMKLHGDYAYYLSMFNGAKILRLLKAPYTPLKAGLQNYQLNWDSSYQEEHTITFDSDLSAGRGWFQYWFDFANSRLHLFGVLNNTSRTLIHKIVSLTDFSIVSETTHDLNITDYLHGDTYGGDQRSVPREAVVVDNYLYWYTRTSSTDSSSASGMIKVNLSNWADVVDIDNQTGLTSWNHIYIFAPVYSMGKLVVMNGLMLNGDTLYKTSQPYNPYGNDKTLYNPVEENTPVGLLNHINCPFEMYYGPRLNKCYLATKYNLQSAVTKTAAQSMTVSYTLREV